MRQRPLFLRTINHLLLVTHLLYASLFNGTPEPPSSRPKALRSMVMGCMGVSYGSFCVWVTQVVIFNGVHGVRGVH